MLSSPWLENCCAIERRQSWPQPVLFFFIPNAFLFDGKVSTAPPELYSNTNTTAVQIQMGSTVAAQSKTAKHYFQLSAACKIQKDSIQQIDQV